MRPFSITNTLAAGLLALQAGRAAAQAPAVGRDTSDFFHLLGYRVQERGDLRFAGRHYAVITLREQGSRIPAAQRAELVLSPDLNDSDSDDVKALSRQRITRARSVTGLAIREGRAVTLDDVVGYELIADARDSASGAPLVLYQVMVPERDRFIVLEGRVAAARAERIVPHFRDVAKTLRRDGVIRDTLGGVRYEVTTGYQPAPALSDGRLKLYFNERTHSGLFVATLPDGADDSRRELLAVLGRVEQAETPGEPELRWLAQRNPPPATSQFVLATGHLQGYNGQTLVRINYWHVRHGGRDLLAGYFFEGARGAEAARFAQGFVGMDSYPGAEAATWLVRSITGEPPVHFGPLRGFGAPPHN
ncbi:MAG TPA: hypothetical protein VF541_05610 [Longimicrobium sp.]|jgi:hypothetical protein